MIARLNAASVKALADPEVRNALASEGADPVGSTPEAFALFIAAEKDRLGKLIRASKIELQ